MQPPFEHSEQTNLQEELPSQRLTKSATIIIVTYNHRDTIEPCLRTALENNPFEIIVVDNGSTDGTAEFIAQEFETIRVIESKENRGFGRGVNRGVAEAQGEYLVVLNPDTRCASNALERLLKPVALLNEVIVNPKTLIKKTGKINTCGLIAHFTGLAFIRGYGADPAAYDEYEYVSGVSGVCFALTKQTYTKIGGFDKNIFLYMEDTELSWRVKLQDIHILYVPTAIVYHEYDLEVTPEKLYHLEMGRYYLLRKYLGWRKYLLFAPSFLMTELLTWGYAILNGPEGITQKSKAIRDGMTTPTEDIDCDRGDLLAQLDTTIPTEQLNDSFLERSMIRLANAVYKLNRVVIKA